MGAVNNLTNISEMYLRGTFRVSFSVTQLCFSASASPFLSTTRPFLTYWTEILLGDT